MGLRGFSPWLRERFPQAFRSVHYSERPYDHVYVDVNTILYTCARIGRERSKVLSTLLAFVHNLISIRCQPIRSLYLAVDGSASIPKLSLQRLRRKHSGDVAEREGCFDCRQLTPGCVFMTKVVDTLVATREALVSSSILPQDVKVVIDPATVAGEGEFKILRHLNSQIPSRNERVAIMSTDSDLFLYPLLSDPQFDIDIHIPFLDPDCHHAVLSISRLRSLIEQDIGSRHLSDFVFLSLFSGNDYLPSLPWGNIRQLYDCYIEYQRSKPSGHAPFIHPSMAKFSGRSIRSFFKFYHDNRLPIKHGGAGHHHHQDKATSLDFFSCLSWNIRNVFPNDGFSGKLVDFPEIKKISCADILETDFSALKERPHGSTVDYIPGSIGLTLLSPTDHGRQFLPASIQNIELDCSESSWTQSAPSALLQHYNSLILGQYYERLSASDKVSILPGLPIET